MSIFLFITIFESTAQKKDDVSSYVNIVPVGRLWDGGVFIDPNGDVSVWCVCIAPYDEWCLTIGSAATLVKQSSSNRSSLSDIDFSKFETALLSSDKNKRVYTLKFKKLK